ncbi:hypothetical protein PSD17_25690 [Pseudonocardia sp. D17]|nr:hypothetical protein PSD17_25690 [Pseudonocardia sp. D17]
MLVLLVVGFGSLGVGHLVRSGFLWELQQRRLFRHVCRRVGLTIKDEKSGRPIYPALSRMVGSSEAWSGRVTPLTGQTVGQWEKAADAFSLAMGASFRVSNNGDGTLTAKVGRTPLETTDARVIDTMTVDQRGWRSRLLNIPVAITEGGQRFDLPAIDTHTLIVGESGSGKGSVVWSLLVGLVPGIRAGVVRVWGLDPKRVELSIGRGFFYKYASTTDEMVAMMKELVADMMQRADQIAGKTRKFDPSPEYPMNVIIIDELAYLSSMLPDRKVAAEVNKALQTILALGRATGYMIVGAAQDPRKETIALRDMFPTRVGLRMKTGMIDLVLGSGARADGAYCDQIPDPKEGGAGMAYVIGEGSHVPKLVRFTWCSDDLIMRLSSTLDSSAADDTDDQE